MRRTQRRRGGGKGGEWRGVTVSSANHETAHVELSRASERFTERNPWFFPIQGLRTGREQHVPESSNHSLYLMKLLRDTAEGIITHITHIRTNTYSPTHPPRWLDKLRLGATLIFLYRSTEDPRLVRVIIFQYRSTRDPQFVRVTLAPESCNLVKKFQKRVAPFVLLCRIEKKKKPRQIFPPIPTFPNYACHPCTGVMPSASNP